MSIQKWSERIWLVTLADEPALSEDLLSLNPEIQALPRMPDIVLNMSAVTHFNSSNLSQMLRLRKLAIDREARIRIAGVPDGLWAVFLTTGLDKVFEFARDVPNALAELQMVQQGR
jgi:anti-anti-sigma factor